MLDAHEFLEAIAIVLCTAAVTSVIFQRLKQPVVLGYLLAGMLVGPHAPVDLDADTNVVHTLAELGVILLMFSLGIRFSLRKLVRVGPTATFVTLLQCSLMIWLGYLVGQLLGWSWLACLYAGAVVAISSTTIIVKAFEEQRVAGEFTHIVFGILILQDLAAILLISVLTALSSGEELAALELTKTAGRLSLFLALLFVIGLQIVPRVVRAVVRTERQDTTVVASVGLAFGFAFLAAMFGYSVALGAFIAGAIVAESGVEQIVEQIVRPVRDIFVAIFFVSVGMLIDPREISENWSLVLMFTLLVVCGQVCIITVGSLLTGQSIRTSVKVGMSLAQIGEFSFIMAGVGLAFDVVDRGFYSAVVAVSCITTLLTPWLIRAAEPTAQFIDRKLPRSLQTFAALYGTWLEKLMAGSDDEHTVRIRRLIRWLAVDALLLVAIVIGASVEMERIASWAQSQLRVPENWTKLAVIVGAGVLSAPFAIGLIRVARFLGFELAYRAFPAAQRNQLDFAAAPRRLLVVTLQLAIVLAVGVPLVAITQPFLPAFRGAAVLLFVLLLLAVAFWRSAANLQGHTRAAAQALAESLGRQTRAGRETTVRPSTAQMERILAGLGSPVSVELRHDSAAVDKTLAETNLRGLTGATVLAIQRGGESILVPSGHERLAEGDVLAIAGTAAAVDAAQELLAAYD